MSEHVTITGNDLFPYRQFPEDLSPVSAVVEVDRPWLATVKEVLPTDAPASAKPWCCYVRTVIFYEQPWREVAGNYADHGKIETLLCGHDVIRIGDDIFELHGGAVSHDGERWIMTRRARRRPKLGYGGRLPPSPHTEKEG